MHWARLSGQAYQVNNNVLLLALSRVSGMGDCDVEIEN
jgi:hypothetical protein